LFFLGELDVDKTAAFREDVEPVHERKFVDVFVFDTEEVTIKEVLITTHEGTQESRELAKHKLLDPNVFNDVDVRTRASRNFFGRLVPTFSRRMQGVPDLVTDEKIVKIVTDFLPVRKAEDTALDVKERSVMVGLFDRDVLTSEKSGEDRLFGNGCHVVFLSETRLY
jgi:hypothetical protein